MARELFSIRDLAFSYDAGHPVFDGLDLEVAEGAVTTLIGANGSGKTTLFNLMTKNLSPARGRVLLRGERVDSMKLCEFARSVAIVHQHNSAPDDITVRGLVSYGRFPYRGRGGFSTTPDEDDRMVAWALQVTDLSAFADVAISALSGGQRQRAWIAMALAQGCDVLLLDEPTTYLDIRYQLDILDLVRRLNRDYGMTVVMVLHDINQALYYSDEVVALADGRVVAQGDPAEIVSRPLLREVYGAELDVVDVDGKPFVSAAAPREAEEPVAAPESDAAPDGRRGVPAEEPADADARTRSSLVKEAPVKHRPKVVRGLWAAAGIASFGLGAVGAVLPFIPTTPFILLAAFCFARSSDTLNNWFKSTALYHKVLEGFVTKRQMTVKAKLSIVAPVTVLMAVGFALMGSVPIGRVVLAVVWVAHIVYFGFVVKTDRGEAGASDTGSDSRTGADSSKRRGNPMIKTRLLELLSESRKYIVYQVVWRWVGLLCQIVIALWAALLLDRALSGAIDGLTLAWCAIFVVPSVLLRMACDRRALRDAHLASVDVKSTLRDRIYRKLLQLGPAYRESASSAKVVQLAVEGVEQLEVYFGQYLPQLFYAVVAPLTLFAALAFIDLKAAVVLLVFVPVIPLSIMVVQRIAKRLLSKYWGIYTDLGSGFLENLQGLTTLKVYQADEAAAEKTDAESERFRVITMQVLKMQLNSTSIMDIGAYGGAAAGMLVALWDFFAGQVGVFGVVAVIILAAEFFLPMRRLGSFFHIAMNGMAASDDIFELLDLPVAAKTAPAHIEGDDVSIRLSGVTFGYGEERTVLRSVDMEFPPGSFKAIVGESGCGKSTVANLIMGRNAGYDGSILINGVELSQVNADELMRCITMVSHASHLFKGTVRDNLLLGDPIASDRDMADALQKVGLLGFVQAQGGLEAPVEEGGSNLSGGQRQRLALARALLHDTPAYLFDEATSSIDVESEEAIMRVVHELARTRTVILISHRLANVADADEIYYLEGGAVAEAGTHGGLISHDGPYARLFNQQKALESFAQAGLRRGAAGREEVRA